MSALRRPDRSVVPVAPRQAARARQQRADRRRRLVRRTVLTTVAAAPVLLLAWLLLSTPLFSVRGVTVSGMQRLTADQVRAVADVAIGEPLARVDTGAVARRVRTLISVQSVDVTRGWPSTVRIRVVERTAVAGLLDQTGVTLVDAGGVPFARAKALAPGMVRLQVPRPGPSDATTRAALKVLEDLPPSLRDPLRIVRAASPSSVTLVLAGGRQVIWGSPEQTALKVQATMALLKLPGGTFDVSRPTVVTRR